MFVVLRVFLLLLHLQCPVDGFVMKRFLDAPFQTATTTTMIHPQVQWRLPRNCGARPHHKHGIYPHYCRFPLPSHIMCLSKDSSTHTNTKEEVESATPINGNINTQSTTTTTSSSVMTVDDDDPDIRRTTPQEVKIVVVMNANARGVSASTIRIAQQVFGTASVYVTHTIPEVHGALEQILLLQPLNSSPSHLVVVTMGGDGTLATTIQTMCQILFPSNQMSDSEQGTYTSVMSQLPTIAYVPLGTGNAVGSVVGCSDHAPSTTPITSIYDRLRRRIPFLRRDRGTSRTTPTESSRSLRRLQATLRHIQEAIRQHNNDPVPTPLPVTKLPMMEISNANFTEVCFFAGGTFFKIVLVFVVIFIVVIEW